MSSAFLWGLVATSSLIVGGLLGSWWTPGRRTLGAILAFGAGVHHCLGATIARVEGQEVFSALAERYPNLESTVRETKYQESLTFRSVKSLPVSLD